MKRLLISLFPIILGIAAAEILLLSSQNMLVEVKYMEMGSMIAIVVALIGVAGGIWVQVIQFKKDAGRLDDNTVKVGEVKEDTVYMRPKADGIDENVKIIRDDIMRTILPNMAKLSGVDTLVRAHEVEKEIKARQSPHLAPIDTLKGAISLVYEENARLAALHIELQKENAELKRENEYLRQFAPRREIRRDEYDLDR